MEATFYAILKNLRKKKQFRSVARITNHFLLQKFKRNTTHLNYTCNLSPSGVDFTNIFTNRFYGHSSQKHKSQSSRQYLFTLLGSARVKALRRTLMKSSPGLLNTGHTGIAWTPCFFFLFSLLNLRTPKKTTLF